MLIEVEDTGIGIPERYVDALTVALEVEGIGADAVGDGRDAIKAFRDGQYDVVLLDLMLPSVSGLDVLRAIRRDSSTPVIIVSAKDGSEIVTFGNVSLDVGRYQLSVAGTTFDLPRKEFEVMSMLMERAGRVVTRDWLLDEVWGMDWGDTKSLDQHIRRLRRKLETHETTPASSRYGGSDIGSRGDPCRPWFSLFQPMAASASL